jgi:D-alanine-D-alanine ligase
MAGAHRQRVAVLRGGPSEEYELSMRHGAEIIAALAAMPNYEPIDVTIAKSGVWLVHGFERTPQQALDHVDVVYIALRGHYGEDGGVQRTVSRLSIPYVGSRPYPSSIAMHKMLTKEHVRNIGVHLAPHMRATKTGVSDVAATAALITTLFQGPYILKPMRGGSGIGQLEASSAVSIAQALRTMFDTYDDVLVEQKIIGRSVTCGVIEGLRGASHYTTPVVEIVYEDDAPQSIYRAHKEVPARISRAAKEVVAEAAKRAHATLGLSGLSRTDFVVTNDDTVVFLETNTLPVLTGDSPLTAGLTALGVETDELLPHLLRGALR